MWGLTQRQWFRELIAWQAREAARANQQRSHAWLTASLTRTKKMPTLKKLLVSEGKRKRQTVEEQKSMLQSLIGRKAKPRG